MLYLIILGHCLSPSLGEFTALVSLALDIWLKEDLSLLFFKALLYPQVCPVTAFPAPSSLWVWVCLCSAPWTLTRPLPLPPGLGLASLSILSQLFIYFNFSGLNIYYFTVFCGLGIQPWLPWVLCFIVSERLLSRCLLSLWSQLMVWLGKHLLTVLLM